MDIFELAAQENIAHHRDIDADPGIEAVEPGVAVLCVAGGEKSASLGQRWVAWITGCAAGKVTS